MPDPRQGRAGQAGFSPRLGIRDPRLRTNQVAALTNTGLDSKSVSTDGAGRQRISAADELKFLATKRKATDPPIDTEAREAFNQLLARLRGQR